MLSVQTNIALQLVRTLNPVELNAFAREFEQMISTRLAKVEPVQEEPFNIPEMAFSILKNHRDKHGIPTRGNLHDYLDVAGYRRRYARSRKG